MTSPLFIGRNIIELDCIDSTNNYAANAVKYDSLPDGTVIMAHEQVMGRGQRGAFWQSEKGKNLTCTFILFPNFLSASNQFYLSMAVSLGILEFLDAEVRKNKFIKWPNDIIMDGHKIAGILIESSLQKGHLEHSLIGIGLNINQKIFDVNQKATSLANVKGKEQNIKEKLIHLSQHLEKWYLKLKKGNFKELRSAYLQRLYLLDTWTYFTVNNQSIYAKICDINEYGQLIILGDNGKKTAYYPKEIKLTKAYQE